MNLVLSIALTHIRRRIRQTLVAIAGVTTGVGVAIMMAAMMEGSQDDFIKTLVDALPHISVTDELRAPNRQPADITYRAAEIHGLTPEVRRPGIKSPMTTIASLQTWVPGVITPSVQSKAVLRFAGRNLTISVIGIDPHTEAGVSNLAAHMRQGSLASLYRASNAILLGDRLASKIGARVNSNITLASAEGATMNATVVGTFHSGFRMTDETTGYVLLKTAQILERQTGVINEIRVRTHDPMAARLISERIGEQTGYRSISWQEAQEDLLAAITLRNVLMYAGGELWYLQHHFHHYAREDARHRHSEIAWFQEPDHSGDFHHRGGVRRAGRSGLRMAVGLPPDARACLARVQDAILGLQSPAGALFGQALLVGHRRRVGFKPDCRLLSGTRCGPPPSRRYHQGRHMSVALIEARNVTKVLRETVQVTLVQNINLTIHAQEFVAITGPSGSGKSSLLYLLGLLDLPTSGDVLIDGRSTGVMTEDERADVRLSRIGFVFQFHFLLPEFSITENVALPMRARGRLSSQAITARAEELLVSLGLGDHRHKTPDQLSGGQRQRVAVARALANDPPVILADEPTGSLDTQSTSQVFGILRDLVEVHSKTVVAVTHDTALASQMHRRIHVVDGRLSQVPLDATMHQVPA